MNVLGTLTLGDILCQKEAIAKDMKVIHTHTKRVGNIIQTCFDLDHIR